MNAKFFLLLILTLFRVALTPALAREPAATLIEIVSVEKSDHIPASCRDIHLDGENLIFSDAVLAAIETSQPRKDIHLGKGISALEDVELAVMNRSVEKCTLWLATTGTPYPADLLPARGESTPAISQLEISADLLKFQNAGTTYQIPAGSEYCLVPIDAKSPDCGLSLFHYGLFPLRDKVSRSITAEVRADSVHQGRFLAPGDRDTYAVQIPQPGMLIVEFDINTSPLMVDIAIKDPDGKEIGSGGAVFSAAQTAYVRLEYSGSGPADYDVGFLFNPDNLPSCRLKTEPTQGETMRAKLQLVNETPAPLSVPVPDAGSVSWEVDGRLWAGAHPGRAVELRLLQPGEEILYQTLLARPEKAAGPITAIVRNAQAEVCRATARLTGE